MKKLTSIVIFLVGCVPLLYAQNDLSFGGNYTEWEWSESIPSLKLTGEMKEGKDCKSEYGICLGNPQEKTYIGLMLNLFYYKMSNIENVYGGQISLFNLVHNNYGVQLGTNNLCQNNSILQAAIAVNAVMLKNNGAQVSVLINAVTGDNHGCQMSAVGNTSLNNCGFQLGTINHVRQNNQGVQWGFLNVARNQGQQNGGRQIGIVNANFKKGSFQIGIFNTSEDSNLQIGLLNHAPSGNFFWLMPFVNW